MLLPAIKSEAEYQQQHHQQSVTWICWEALCLFVIDNNRYIDFWTSSALALDCFSTFFSFCIHQNKTETIWMDDYYYTILLFNIPLLYPSPEPLFVTFMSRSTIKIYVKMLLC